MIGRRLNVIGQPRRRVDARAKVTGQTRFADDIMLSRMVHCKLLRSSVPHARILRMEIPYGRFERRIQRGQFVADGQGMDGAPGIQRQPVAH